MMSDLPKFSGLRTKCPKCTSAVESTRMRKTVAGSGMTIESMIRTCTTCGYAWDEQPADRSTVGEGGDKPRSAPADWQSLLGLVDTDKLVANLLEHLKKN